MNQKQGLTSAFEVLKNYPFPTLRWVSKGENI